MPCSSDASRTVSSRPCADWTRSRRCPRGSGYSVRVVAERRAAGEMVMAGIMLSGASWWPAGGEGRDGVDDGLGLLEIADCERTPQAADAALLVAALGESVVDHCPGVGPYGPGLDLAADPATGVETASEEAGREPELGGIGARDRVSLGVEGFGRRDGTEYLLLDDVRIDVLDLEQRRAVEGPCGQSAIGSGAAAHDRLGVGQSGPDHLVHARDVGLADERAPLRCRVHPVTDPHLLDDAGQPRPDLLGYPALDQDPRTRHAELPSEGNDPCREHRNDGVEVGVVEDDHRRLAAELEVHPLEGGSAARGDQPADRGAAGVADDLNVR